MDDDVIRRALGSHAEADPSPAILQRAVARGATMRRRRLAALATGAALIVVAAGAVVASRGDGEQIVGVSPAPGTTAGSTTTAAPVTTSPTTVPASDPPSTLPTTTEVVTSPPTTPAGTSAPFVVPPEAPAMPCDPVPALTVDSVVVSVVAPAPARTDGFLQARFAGSTRAAIELWSSAGLVATIADTVPDTSDQWYCPTSLVPLAYDGRFAWAAVSGPSACVACSSPTPPLVVRVDVTSGEVATGWSSPDPARVFDLLPVGDGAGVVLAGPFGEPGELRALATGGAVLGEWPVDVPITDARLRRDPAASGGLNVGYTTGASAMQPPRLHLVDLATGTELAVDLTGTMIDPVITGWAVRDGFADVLLLEQWEGIDASVLVRVDLESPQRSSTAVVGKGACWTDTALIARGTWTFSSESVYDEPGRVELVDPSDLSVVRDLGIDTYGGALGCLGGERVALTAHDAVPADGTGSPASIVPGSQRTVILGGGDQIELGRDTDLFVVGRNADD